MKKLILNIAISIDGYIASEEGTYDWIVGDGDASLNTGTPYDFNAFIESVDTVVMGRKAFDDCPMEMFKNHKIIVATTHEIEDYDNVTFVNGDICEILKEEQQLPGKDIYLFGGGVLLKPLIENNLIDEYILGIIPTILGKGRKLFVGHNEEIKLHLETYHLEDGTFILHYTKR